MTAVRTAPDAGRFAAGPLVAAALVAGALFALAAPARANPALTVVPATMRAAASRHAPVVQAVPANAEIDIQGCGPRWCYGSWRGLSGYLPTFAVQGAPPVAAPPPAFGFAPPPPPIVTPGPILISPPAYRWSGAYVGLGF